MSYKPRLTKPEKGNKYYNTKANGGYSNAIKGYPTDKDCDVLPNCVGYAYGRFNEIGGWGKMKYLTPTNAEKFMQYKGDLESGLEPQVGACMVWQKGATLSGSDGAGHVAIVEKVISATQVITSESGWGSKKPFWTKTRKKGSNGNWGAGSGYKFLGFIYNPACRNESIGATPSSASTNAESKQFKIGDVVEFTGTKHYTSANGTNGKDCKPGKAKITATYDGKHPYHLVAVSGEGSTVYGWVDAIDVSTAVSTVKYTVTDGDTLWGIAKKFLGSGAKYPKIMEANNMKNAVVCVGDVLIIPDEK